ncbi:MAG: FKBP-type peptidyl-prolyl cis-trans isomerase [Ignavibacteria bacterium]|jgi:peptidylprolyl isomerase|nr:FKBP-type peptidyl-prolyl cis-trans isomerase [Ignavibacteria bacterium]
MTAQNGKSVSLHYRGTLTDGTVFDESYGSEPLSFVIGSGLVIPGFEKGIIDMQVGEKRRIFIPAEEAYGKRTDELIIEFPNDSIPDEIHPQVGDVMQLQLTPENVVEVEVIELKDESVVFDANHKLADKDLTFEIELLSID